MARFHNIYGPYGTWKGGREKAPAAFCRKVGARGGGGGTPTPASGAACRMSGWLLPGGPAHGRSVGARRELPELQSRPQALGGPVGARRGPRQCCRTMPAAAPSLVCCGVHSP